MSGQRLPAASGQIPMAAHKAPETREKSHEKAHTNNTLTRRSLRIVPAW